MTPIEHLKQEIIQLLNDTTDTDLLDLVLRVLLFERQQ